MHLPKYEALKLVNRDFGTTIFIKVHKVKGQNKRRNQVDSVCDLVQGLGSSNDLRGEVCSNPRPIEGEGYVKTLQLTKFKKYKSWHLKAQ